MGATETRSASSFKAKTASLAVVALKDKAYCKYLPANLEVAKKRLLDCFFCQIFCTSENR